jgi:hypothetical protein
MVKFPKVVVSKVNQMAADYQRNLKNYLAAVADGMGLEGDHNINLKEMAFEPATEGNNDGADNSTGSK